MVCVTCDVVWAGRHTWSKLIIFFDKQHQRTVWHRGLAERQKIVLLYFRYNFCGTLSHHRVMQHQSGLEELHTFQFHAEVFPVALSFGASTSFLRGSLFKVADKKKKEKIHTWNKPVRELIQIALYGIYQCKQCLHAYVWKYLYVCVCGNEYANIQAYFFVF